MIVIDTEALLNGNVRKLEDIYQGFTYLISLLKYLREDVGSRTSDIHTENTFYLACEYLEMYTGKMKTLVEKVYKNTDE